MRGFEIVEFCARDPYIRRVFKGVYSIDHLPELTSLPSSIVVNTDKKSGKGKHWVVVSVDAWSRGYFFDSYGFPPLQSALLTFMKENCDVWQYSSTPVQSIASVKCGQFCLFYLYHTARGQPVSRVLSPFSTSNPRVNDLIVSRWYQSNRDRLRRLSKPQNFSL